ncbi:MAG: tetratricopeptide repeat protein [Thermoproteota archaeon]|nr:tetratricopeptide repeat protein [Thermoproteota archaeon]
MPLVNKNEDSTELPLVMNVVIRYWGEDISPPISRGASDKGVLMIRGVEIAKTLGIESYIYKSSISDLKKRIDQGVPPIVIMPGIQGTVQHAMIVSGYDNDERRILTYVPEPDTVGAIPESKFKQDWEQDDMTAILMLPSDMKELLKNEDLKFAKSNRACFEAEGLRQDGKVNEAMDKLQKALEIDPDNPQVWVLLGGIYNETNSEQATICYEKAIKINPRSYLAHRGLGNYYLKRKDYSLAEAYYSKAIDISPFRFAPIYKNRAVARMQIGNNKGAKEDLIKYLEQMPTAQDRQDIREALTELQ